MKRYPSRYEGPDTAPARCLHLLERASPPTGIVLDLGCGRAPLAEPVKELGFEYMGVDIDRAALAEVSERGFETHELDLAGTEEELARALREIVAGRRLSAVLAVDLLEHLIEPDALLRALRPLSSGGSLIVSLPNITHLNIAAKILLGRWDPTECGLLDDTHLRYFSDGELARLFSGTGWRQVAAADAENPDSPDQRFPADAPTLRPGTPARDLLRRLRSASEPNGDTYQFVRHFVPSDVPIQTPYRWAVEPEADEDRVFASVLVPAGQTGDATHERLLRDLAAQTVKGFEIVDVPNGIEGWNSGIDAAAGRYLFFLEATTRISPRWIESFQVPEPLGGRVLKAGVVSVAARKLGGEDTGSLVETGKPLRINPLDLLAQERLGPTVLAAYAVPVDAVRAAGLRFEAEYRNAGPTVFLMRAAELCGVLALDEVTVAVERGAFEDAESELAAVADSLDRAPIILPARSAGRILTLRRAASASPRWRVGSWLRHLKGRREHGSRCG
jgi:SAM-dependent methyltransferase